MDSKRQHDILFITPSYPPTYCGIGNFTFRLVEILRKNQKNVFIVSNQHQKLEKNIDEERKDWMFQNSKVDLNFSNIFKIISIIKSIKPRTVNIQFCSLEAGRSPFLTILAIIIKLKFPKIDLQLTIHEFDNYTFLGKIKYTLAMFFANKVFFSGKKQVLSAEKFSFNLINNRFKIIPITNTVSINKSIDSTKDLVRRINKSINICFHGLIQPKNGLEYLLYAISDMNRDEYKLNILGDFSLLIDYGNKSEEVKDYQEKLRNFIEEKKLSVQIFGDIDPSSKRFKDVLNGSDIFIVPDIEGLTSRRTSFWNVFLQSKILTLVSYTENESEDFFKDHLITFKPKSSEEIYNKIKEITRLDDIFLKESYAKQEKLREKYSPRNLEQQIVKLFETQ
jgi:glycosyltransferase involved in cell wall biosynthesis